MKVLSFLRENIHVLFFACSMALIGFAAGLLSALDVWAVPILLVLAAVLYVASVAF